MVDPFAALNIPVLVAERAATTYILPSIAYEGEEFLVIGEFWRDDQLEFSVEHEERPVRALASDPDLIPALTAHIAAQGLHLTDLALHNSEIQGAYAVYLRASLPA